MSVKAPRFTISNSIAAGLTAIERARGFLEAATLSEEWLRRMSHRALLLEAHHTTHIEGTQLTIEQAERAWSGEMPRDARMDDIQELLNYRDAFHFVSDYLDSGDPVTEGLIREIHKRLVQGVRGGAGGPGEYRSGYDFKRLFTISEYYDRDRPAFYRAIQSVRKNGMDLTEWLEFFVTGLATQLTEMKERGAIAIRRDVLGSTYNLNLRQMLAVEHLLTKATIDIRTFQRMWPDVTRRTLQRDLSGLQEKGLVRAEGGTNSAVYRLTKRAK